MLSMFRHVQEYRRSMHKGNAMPDMADLLVSPTDRKSARITIHDLLGFLVQRDSDWRAGKGNYVVLNWHRTTAAQSWPVISHVVLVFLSCC